MGLSDLYFGPRTIIVGSDEDPHSALPESALDNVLSPPPLSAFVFLSACRQVADRRGHVMEQELPTYAHQTTVMG